MTEDGSAHGRAGAPLDADAFLRVSGALKAGLQRLSAARLTDAQRERWQRRLLEITNTATRDLRRAAEQLDRFESDWQREVGG